jgi:hypothetical protein
MDIEIYLQPSRERNDGRLMEILSQSDDSLDAAKGLHAAGKHLYWKEKNIKAAVSALRAGIDFALPHARRQSSEALRRDLLGEAKGMSYDLASFCWPGWDEPGIEVTEEEIAEGERGAESNLELAIELSRSGAPLANAYWMVGAYLLARDNPKGALDSFAKFKEIAASSGDQGQFLLATGYESICSELLGEARDEHLQRLYVELTEKDPENGPFYADQLRTARRVFSPQAA